MRNHRRSHLQALLLWTVATLWSTPGFALQPDLSNLSSLPVHTTSPVLVAKALQQVGNKSQPLQYAVHAALPLGLDDGLWDEPEPGIARWRSRVASPGAQGLSLSLRNLNLPEGTELWLYDDAGRLVQGPYAQIDGGPLQQLWTALVPGDAAVLELRTPTATRDEVRLDIDRLSHAFIDLSKADALIQAKSGSCNVDTVCSDGNNWRDQIRSVALVAIDGIAICSGELLNNQRQDRDPLFITAHHCGISSLAVATSVVLYWNYQTTICGGAPNGSLAQSQSGATLLAGNVGSDFTLLRLNRRPSTSYQVFYSGWDADDAAPRSGVAVHHPEGDEKRISTYSAPANRQSICIETGLLNCVRQVDAWRVNWTRGSTAGGSSGGGLWNQSGRLVGTLSGGNASCSNLNGDDYFARFAGGYTASAAPSGQLKAWLDPDNVGITAIDGINSTGSVGAAVSSNSGGGSVPMRLLLLMLISVLLRYSIAGFNRSARRPPSSGRADD